MSCDSTTHVSARKGVIFIASRYDSASAPISPFSEYPLANESLNSGTTQLRLQQRTIGGSVQGSLVCCSLGDGAALLEVRTWMNVHSTAKSRPCIDPPSAHPVRWRKHIPHRVVIESAGGEPTRPGASCSPPPNPPAACSLFSSRPHQQSYRGSVLLVKVNMFYHTTFLLSTHYSYIW